MSDSLLDHVMSQRDILPVIQRIQKSDEQSAEMFKKSWMTLWKSFTMSSREREAFNRLNTVIAKPNMDQALMRNTVFKAANALGIKLPSSMFAGEKVALSGDARQTIKSLEQKLKGVPGIMKVRNLKIDQDSKELVVEFALSLNERLKSAQNVSHAVHKLLMSKIYNREVNYHWSWRNLSVSLDSKKSRYQPEEQVPIGQYFDTKVGVNLVCEFDYTLGVTGSVDRVATRYLQAKHKI